MKTYLSISGAMLALGATLLAQAPPPPTAAPLPETYGRRLPSNAPTAVTPPAIPMSAQPPGPAGLRPLPQSAGPTAPGATAPSPAAPATSPAASAVPDPTAAGLAVTPGTNAPASRTSDQIYQKDGLRLQELELNEFLDKIYSETVGRTIIRAPNLPAAKITFRIVSPLTRPEFVQLLDSVLAMNGISMIPVGEKFVKAVASTQALAEGAPFGQKKAEDLPESGQYLTQVIQLKYLRPSEVQPAIQPFSKTQGGIVVMENSGVIVLRDFTENVKRMMEIIEKVDVTYAGSAITNAIIPIKYALASEIAGVLGNLQGAGGGVSTGTSGGAAGGRAGGVGGGVRGGGLRGGAAGGLGAVGGAGVSGFGGATGAGGYNPATGGFGGVGGVGGVNTGGINTGAFGTAGANQSSFQQRLQQIVNRAVQGSGGGGFQILGDVRIIADERTNSLLVFANEQDMKTILAVIAKLDVVLAQVLIETIIMTVSLGDTLDYGVSAAQSPKKFTSDSQGAGGYRTTPSFLDFLGTAATNSFISPTTSQLPGSGFSYFGKFGSTWDVALTAIASDSRLNVIQRPRIQTSHAKPASLFIGSTVPYVTSTYAAGGISGPSSQYQQLRVGIGLNVTPFINPDGLVVMTVDETIDELSGSTPIAGVGDVPNTASRTISADIAVRDRDTVILGGFIRNSDDRSKGGVPFLKDIPLLGALFSSKTSTKKRDELIVLMRPTVLPTPAAAATMTQYETDNLPGIRAAERDMASEEARRLKQQGIDPNRPAPMFKDERPRGATELLPTTQKELPVPETP